MAFGKNTPQAAPQGPAMPGAPTSKYSLDDLARAQGATNTLTRQAYQGQGLGSLGAGLGSIIAAMRLNKVQNDRRGIDQYNERLMIEKADLGNKLDQMRLENSKMSVEMERENLDKMRGSNALTRASMLHGEGKMPDLQDIQLARIEMTPTGSIKTNAQKLQEMGIDVNAVKGSSLELATILNRPYSQLTHDGMMEVLAKEDRFRRDMNILGKRLSTPRPLGGSDLSKIAEVGNKLGNQFRNLMSKKEAGEITDEQADELFKTTISPMFRIYSEGMNRLGLPMQSTLEDAASALVDMNNAKAMNFLKDMGANTATIGAMATMPKNSPINKKKNEAPMTLSTPGKPSLPRKEEPKPAAPSPMVTKKGLDALEKVLSE